MLKLNTIIITGDIPFQMYLLSDRIVKKLNQEFEFYSVRFYREERVSEPTVCMDYPKGNLFWFIEFQKFVTDEILSRDARYEKEWNTFLYRLKNVVKSEFDTLKKSIASISGKQVLQAMFEYNLRDYQAYDMYQLDYLLENEPYSSALLLSEQRTGKTRVAIAELLHRYGVGCTVLIVCPKISIQGWVDEFSHMAEYRKEFGTEFYCKVIKNVGSIVSANSSFRPNTRNVRIITYDLFKKLNLTQLRNLISQKHTNRVILIGDEIHRLRNFKTMQSDAIFNFKDICIRDKTCLTCIGITGTPAVKDSYDVFGSLSFINFSKIGFQPYYKDFNQFKEYFYNCEDTSYGKICRSIRREGELQHIIRCNAIQTKQKELNLFKGYTKKYLKYTLKMDKKQEDIYDSIRDEFRYKDDVDCKNALAQGVRLLQACTDPSALVGSYAPVAPKLQWILKFAEKNKFQFIVMAKSLQALCHLSELFDREGVTFAELNGAMNRAEREENEKRFHEKKAQVYLIQLDAGRESLTLPEAQCTIFLGRDFAQGYNEQAEARMTPIDGTVCTKYVIDLVMEDTVEERIYDTLVVRKKSIGSVNTLFKDELKGGELNERPV